MSEIFKRRHAVPDKHWRITSVVLEGPRMMAFAVGDDGETTVYIPKPIIERHNIGIEDEGVGFFAPVRAPSPSAGDGAYPQVMAPIVWDTEENRPAQENPTDLTSVLASLKEARHKLGDAIEIIEEEMSNG